MDSRIHTYIVRFSTPLVLIACVGIAASAQAQMTAPEVRQARHSLARYDIEGDGTTEVIEALGRFLDGAERSADAREARFLRAAVATDLLIVAHRLGDGALAERVAAAYGSDGSRVLATIERDLGQVAFGAYGAVVRDALDGLRALRALQAGETPDWQALRGVRRDVLYLGWMRSVLAGEGDRLAQLGALTPDPCGDDDAEDENEGAEAANTCPAPYHRFDAIGRRAVATLQATGGAFARIDEHARHGDPFGRAVAVKVAEDQELLRAVELRPTPRLSDTMRIADARGAHHRAAPDLVLALTPGELHYAWSPRVRLGDDGELRMLPEGQPLLPETRTIALPGDFRPALLPIDEIEGALRELARPEDLAIGASPDVPSHVFARVLLSIRDAELPAPMLLGRGDDHTPRAVPLEVVRSREATALQRQVRVRVRLGGYTVNLPGGSQDIPRVRDEDGLRFDVAALAQLAERTGPESASVSFMSAVTSGPLLSAAFSVAPEGTPLTLILP